MRWIAFSVQSNDKLAPLIEDFLLEHGASAVTLQDVGDNPIFEPDLGTTPLWQMNTISALFDHAVDGQSLFTDLKTLLGTQAPASFQLEILEDRDWEREWLKYYQSMCFADRLWVSPSEELLTTGQNTTLIKPGQILLKLDPGLAFGTGTHETTSLCLEWLASHELQGKTLIDYGCGSGILAIAAKLLGASQVWALDIDPQALVATNENAKRNGLEGKLKVFSAEDFLKFPQKPCFDIVVANILAGPLQKLAPELANLLVSDGIIVLSGILMEQAEDVVQSYQRYFDNIEITYKNDWTRLVAQKRN